jgi:hypothetical protein
MPRSMSAANPRMHAESSTSKATVKTVCMKGQDYMKHLLKASLLAALVLFVGSADASRDGSGTYTLPAGNPVTSGTVISSSWANTTLQDIADGVSASLAKDGQTVPTANLPMGGFKHTGVADGTARNHYASVGQAQDFSVQTLGSVAGTNTITGALSPAITSYATGMLIGFTPVNTVSGATTIAVNGLAARSIVKWDGDALAAGDIVSGVPALLQATSSAFLLLNPQTYDSTKLVGATAPQINIKGTSTGNANQNYIQFSDSAGTSKGVVGDTSASDQDVYLSNATSAANTNVTANTGSVRLSFDNGSTFPTTFSSTATTINGVTVTPDSYSGTGTLNGCTTSPTTQLEARAFGRLVVVQMTGNSCTSTGGSGVFFVTSSLPASLQPATIINSNTHCGMTEGLNNATGTQVIVFASANSSTFSLGIPNGSWAGAGTKSFQNVICTYFR